MALWDKIKGEFIDVIDWTDDTTDSMVWKFPRYNNEIKNGAQLIVRESQVVVFMHEGEIGDIFNPGRYELITQNLPILTTLRSWKYAFNAPFKCDVFFLSTKQFTDLKWGTKNPIMMRDPEFGPVRLRALALGKCGEVTGKRGGSSVGRTSRCQREGHGFESRPPL